MYYSFIPVMAKLNFQQLHDPSEMSLKSWFKAQFFSSNYQS